MDSKKKNLDEQQHCTYSRYNGNSMRDCDTISFGENNTVKKNENISVNSGSNVISVAMCEHLNIYCNEINSFANAEQLFCAFEAGFRAAVRFFMNV